MTTETNGNDLYLNQYKRIHYLRIYNLGKNYWPVGKRQHLKHNNLQTWKCGRIFTYLAAWKRLNGCNKAKIKEKKQINHF